MPDTLIYAYPWDFERDERAVDRAAALAVNTVAVAASYHTARAARPLHPARPLVDVRHPACYIPVRPAAWKGRRLVPRVPDWVESDDSFGSARDRLQASGLTPQAWVVLTHNSALGRECPDLTICNAFGDRYDYALCPAAPDVVEYCTTLVEELVVAGPGSGLILEACGSMGFEHNGAHEKTSLAGWSGVQRALLSLCFCTACTARYSSAGIDQGRLRSLVRRGVLVGATSPEELLGPDLADEVARVRTSVNAELRSRLAARAKALQPNLRITVHGCADRWSAGSFSTVATEVGDGIDAVVASCFDVARGTGELASLHALVKGQGRAGLCAAVGGIVSPTADWADEVVTRDRIAQMRAAGLDELHLYHLGLVGQAGFRVLQQMAGAFRDAGVSDRTMPPKRPETQ